MQGLLLFLLQIGAIVIAARLLGAAFKKIRQPQVMGEMVAGILLGPSFLGWLAPDFSARLFPAQSLATLGALSQIGLILFMFLVGLELDPKLLRQRGHAAVVTSHASIIAPFFLGALLALHLYPRYSDRSVRFSEFALFLGAAMSVTAFPVLARILTERNLLGTKVGAVTIACAAVDDVTAWCILAGVVALVRANAGGGALPTIAGSAVYVALMLFVVKPALTRVESYYHLRGRMTQGIVAGVLLGTLASAWTTEWVGIHALFGAFLLGAVMPKEPGFVHDLRHRLEDVTVVLFLPLFFAYTGLRTRIGILDDPSLWGDCALVILVAVAGKLGGSSLAARASGLSWREAGALGVLMNTRGLMELVILSIGLDLGIISPVVFVMMVLMALVTTFVTTPLLEWIYPAYLIRAERIGGPESRDGDAVLIPVSLPSSGPELVEVARRLVAGEAPRIYALHLVRPEDRDAETAHDVRPAEQPALRPLLEAAAASGATVRPLTFVSRDFGDDICEVARAKAAGLVLLGWHKPVMSASILSGTVARVMWNAPADVAVYVARRPPPWSRVLVPFSRGAHDLAALELARRIAVAGSTEVTVLHVVSPERAASERSAGELIESMGPPRLTLKIVESADPRTAAADEARRGYDLVIVGAQAEWGLEPRIFGTTHELLARESPGSLLVVHALSRRETAGRVASEPSVPAGA